MTQPTDPSALADEIDGYIQRWLNAEPLAAHGLAAFMAGSRDRILAALRTDGGQDVKADRFITTWRKPPPNVLDWDHHTSQFQEDAASVVANLKAQGVHQFHTFRLGEMLPELSSEY